MHSLRLAQCHDTRLRPACTFYARLAHAPLRMTLRRRSRARRDALPAFIPPQLTQLVDEPPARADWAHELKYDGYRIHARVDHGRVKLLTRTGLDWTHRYGETAKVLAALGQSACKCCPFSPRFARHSIAR